MLNLNLLFYKLKEIYFSFMSLLPVDEKMVLFESVDYGDNSRFLYESLISLDKHYRYIWIVKNRKLNKKMHPNINFVERNTLSYQFYYRWRARYCFYTHTFIGCVDKKNQVRCFLTHGIPLKDSKNCFWNYSYNTDIICTSEEASRLRCETFGGGIDKVRILGFPRNDELFIKSDVLDKLDMKRDSKYIVWMPTFKHSTSKNRNDFKVKKNKDISLITEDTLERLNLKLLSNDYYLIIKFHPAQAMEYVDNINLTNIKTYVNANLHEKNVSVYELLANSEALITDFSSVFIDYLLVNKPIGFELGDINDYGRGFLVDKPLDYMPGEKIYNQDDLIRFCENVFKGNDNWKRQRESLRDRMHEVKDGNSSIRILKYFQLI